MSAFALFDNGTVITPQNRDRWLALRRPGPKGFAPVLGTSQLAQAVGLSPFGSTLELFAEMRGILPPFAGNRATRRGTALQPWVKGEYELMTGARVLREEVFFAGPVFWGIRLVTTLDGITDAGRIVEFKTTGHRQAQRWGLDGTDQIPPHVYCQVVGQQLCSGLDVTDVVAAIGEDDLRIFPVLHRPDLAEDLLERLERFCWQVAHNIPPAAERAEDLQALAKIYDWAEGTVQLGDEVLPLVDELAEVQARQRDMKGLEDRAKVLKAAIARAVGPATAGQLSDGRTVTCKLVKVPGRTQTVNPYEFLRVDVKEFK